MQIRAKAAAGIEPATWPRTIRKSPSGQIPSASPGEIGELRRPAEAWTLPIFDTKLAAGPTPTTTTAITTAAAIRATQRWRATAARAVAPVANPSSTMSATLPVRDSAGRVRRVQVPVDRRDKRPGYKDVVLERLVTVDFYDYNRTEGKG